MTREEAIQFLDNMKHEEAGRAIGKDGFYAELMGYHVEALNMAIKALEGADLDGYSSRLWKAAYERGKADAKAEQASALDKIRAEINGMTPTYHNPDWSITNLVPISEVLKIIDKYKAESKLDGDPIDIDKAVEHYEETLEMLKGIDLEVDG